MENGTKLSESQLAVLIEEKCQKLSFMYLSLVKKGFDRSRLSLSGKDNETICQISFVNNAEHIEVDVRLADDIPTDPATLYDFLCQADDIMQQTAVILNRTPTVH